MAIVVEEDRSRTGGLIVVLVWLVIFGVIAAGTYYVFFKKPELIELKVPATFEDTARLSKITLTPEEIVNNPVFSVLKPYVSLPEPAAVGRENPFAPF